MFWLVGLTLVKFDNFVQHHHVIKLQIKLEWWISEKLDLSFLLEWPP